jgi:hypothetical protein
LKQAAPLGVANCSLGFQLQAAVGTGNRDPPLMAAQRAHPLASQQLVNGHQPNTHLSQLLQEVEQGQAVAAPGAMRGQIQLSDGFDAPLDGLIEA